MPGISFHISMPPLLSYPLRQQHAEQRARREDAAACDYLHARELFLGYTKPLKYFVVRLTGIFLKFPQLLNDKFKLRFECLFAHISALFLSSLFSHPRKNLACDGLFSTIDL